MVRDIHFLLSFSLCCWGFTRLNAHFYLKNGTFSFSCVLLRIDSYLLWSCIHSFVDLCQTSRLWYMFKIIHLRLLPQQEVNVSVSFSTVGTTMLSMLQFNRVNCNLDWIVNVFLLYNMYWKVSKRASPAVVPVPPGDNRF